MWNHPTAESLNSPYCGSIYEDVPLNYLVDYSYVIEEPGRALHARLVGLDPTGQKVFDYEYLISGSTKVFNATPLHLENTAFPDVGSQSLNLSTRVLVGPAEDIKQWELLVSHFEKTDPSRRSIISNGQTDEFAQALSS